MKNRYKKHKTHIIYAIKIQNKKLPWIIMLIIFNTIFLFAFNKIETNFQPIVKALATAKVKNHIMKTIDYSISKIPDTYTDYSNICQIHKNPSGEIISITLNTNAVKNIKSKLSKTIVQNISQLHSEELNIPIGNLTNTYILSGRGPKIPIKIIITSSPDIHIESYFEDAGINQTKHKISIFTNIEAQIILPYETMIKKVTYESLLSETIIVGKVPNVYISK